MILHHFSLEYIFLRRLTLFYNKNICIKNKLLIIFKTVANDIKFFEMISAKYNPNIYLCHIKAKSN